MNNNIKLVKIFFNPMKINISGLTIIIGATVLLTTTGPAFLASRIFLNLPDPFFERVVLAAAASAPFLGINVLLNAYAMNITVRPTSTAVIVLLSGVQTLVILALPSLPRAWFTYGFPTYLASILVIEALLAGFAIRAGINQAKTDLLAMKANAKVKGRGEN